MKRGVIATIYSVAVKYFMNGNWIGRDVPIERIIDEGNNLKTYITYDGIYIKVVRSSNINVGNIAYYKAFSSEQSAKQAIPNFAVTDLSTYTRTGGKDDYRVKRVPTMTPDTLMTTFVLSSLSGSLPIHHLKGAPEAFVVLNGFIRVPDEGKYDVRFAVESANTKNLKMFVMKHYSDPASNTYATVNEFVQVIAYDGSGSQHMEKSMRVDPRRMVTYQIQYYKDTNRDSKIQLYWAFDTGAFKLVDHEYLYIDEVPKSSCFWNKTADGYDEYSTSYDCFPRDTNLDAVVEKCCNDKDCKAVSFSNDNGGCFKKGDRTGFANNKNYTGYTKRTGTEQPKMIEAFSGSQNGAEFNTIETFSSTSSADGTRSSGKRGIPGVTVYEHCWFEGRGVEKPIGKYNINDMGLANDTISSIKIPTGYLVTVYEHANFQGKSQTFSSDVSCLVYNPMRGSTSWNDQISSFIVHEEVAPNGKSKWGKDLSVQKYQELVSEPGYYSRTDGNQQFANWMRIPAARQWWCKENRGVDCTGEKNDCYNAC